MRHVARGQHVYRHGDATEGFFLLLEGRVKLSAPTVSGERLLALCGPGDLFGLDRCAGLSNYPAEAVSQSTESHLLVVSCAALKTALHTEAALATRLVSLLSQRIGVLEEQVEQARLPAQARLARTMLSLTKRLGVEIAPDRFELKLELRHDEIASLAGTGRISVTQALSGWRKIGIVQGTRGCYEVSLSRLIALSELLESQALE
jgi:CRP/FNR family transcriptional regulator, cyclic AMP receptor protein